jgi:hypothetical protein
MSRVPLTRTITEDTHRPPLSVRLGDRENTVWEVEPAPQPPVLTQLSDIKVTGKDHKLSVAQTLINLFIFNKLDPRRVLVDSNREFVYLVKKGETIVVPPLPPHPNVRWIFTLGTGACPIFRITFDCGEHAPGKRKRRDADP